MSDNAKLYYPRKAGQRMPQFPAWKPTRHWSNKAETDYEGYWANHP